MRDYTWQMFEVTGDVEAYLLYRACEMHESATGDTVDTTDGQEDFDEPLQ